MGFGTQFKDFSKDFWGDPGGYITGTNKEGFGGVKKMLFGDPDAIKKAYDDAISAMKSGGGDIKNFLLDREKVAQGYFNPLQSLLGRTYGETPGIAAPQTPGVPGSSPLSSYYGGK